MMKDGCISRVGCSVVLLCFLGCSLCTTPSMGQNGTWVEVMVNGPWDYVPDYAAPPAHPRIILIAPASPGHKPPTILAGPNAAGDKSNQPQLWPGLYTLSIDKVRERPQCPGNQPSTVSLYPYRNVSRQNIQDALDGKAVDPTTHKPIPRFAIALPQPCYATSMYESRSKMDDSQIDKQVEMAYTTWVSLHYFVDSDFVDATINGLPVTFDSDGGSYPPSLSIVMASDSTSNDNECDAVSLMSVESSAKLLGLTGHLYAQFPMMLGSGSTIYQTHNYSSKPKCFIRRQRPRFS